MNQNQYPQINLADWQQVGEGGNGKTCVNPAAPGEILKLNNACLSTLEAVEHEYNVSKAVAGLGISVPEGAAILLSEPATAAGAGRKSSSIAPPRTKKMAIFYSLVAVKKKIVTFMRTYDPITETTGTTEATETNKTNNKKNES